MNIAALPFELILIICNKLSALNICTLRLLNSQHRATIDLQYLRLTQKAEYVNKIRTGSTESSLGYVNFLSAELDFAPSYFTVEKITFSNSGQIHIMCPEFFNIFLKCQSNGVITIMDKTNSAQVKINGIVDSEHSSGLTTLLEYQKLLGYRDLVVKNFFIFCNSLDQKQSKLLTLLINNIKSKQVLKFIWEQFLRERNELILTKLFAYGCELPDCVDIAINDHKWLCSKHLLSDHQLVEIAAKRANNVESGYFYAIKKSRLPIFIHIKLAIKYNNIFMLKYLIKNNKMSIELNDLSLSDTMIKFLHLNGCICTKLKNGNYYVNIK